LAFVLAELLLLISTVSSFIVSFNSACALRSRPTFRLQNLLLVSFSASVSALLAPRVLPDIVTAAVAVVVEREGRVVSAWNGADVDGLAAAKPAQHVERSARLLVRFALAAAAAVSPAAFTLAAFVLAFSAPALSAK
jgi:hypothetical protein